MGEVDWLQAHDDHDSEGTDVTHSEMHDLMLDVFDRLEDLREAGQAEYAHDEDNCFANFDRTAERLKISREKALMVHFTKHYDSLTAYVNGHESQREPIYGRILDAMMYLMLLYGMVEEAEGEEEVYEPSVGERILQGAREAAEIHRGEREPARVTTNWTCEECGKVRNSDGCSECNDCLVHPDELNGKTVWCGKHDCWAGSCVDCGPHRYNDYKWWGPPPESPTYSDPPQWWRNEPPSPNQCFCDACQRRAA